MDLCSICQPTAGCEECGGDAGAFASAVRTEREAHIFPSGQDTARDFHDFVAA